MLKELDMNETDYFTAVRCAYKRIDVLYKRESNPIFSIHMDLYILYQNTALKLIDGC